MCDILVNSCATYADTTIPPLIASFVAAGVDLAKVHIVVGDTDRTETTAWRDTAASVHYVNYKNIDENGLIWAAFDAPALAAPTTDYFFYMHDTCSVGPQFVGLCADFLTVKNGGCDAAKLRPMQSMCMGFYRWSFVTSEPIKAFIASYLNRDPARRPEIKGCCEDRLFKYAQHHRYRVHILPNPNVNDSIIERSVNKYGTVIPRFTEFYEYPGVYKFKTGKYNLDL